ncbi:MAG: hypothetical protein ACKOC5_16545 [Chloroflexota bacterium]
MLLLAALGFGRAYQVWTVWAFFENRMTVSPLYPLISGAVWGAAWLGMAWPVWRGWRRAPRLALGLFLAYSIYAWIDRLLVPGYPGRAANWPFLAGLNGLLLAWCCWALFSRRSKVYFGEVYEQ